MYFPLHRTERAKAIHAPLVDWKFAPGTSTRIQSCCAMEDITISRSMVFLLVLPMNMMKGKLLGERYRRGISAHE